VTLRKAAKSIGFARRQLRYIKPSIGFIGDLIGHCGQCLKAAYVFWQSIRWSRVLGLPQKYLSLLSR
jgi:hypothetical protein